MYMSLWKSMVIDAMKINQDYSSKCSCNISLDEEPNVDPSRFFKPMKDSDEPLWNTCVTHSKLSIIAQVFNIKLNYR